MYLSLSSVTDFEITRGGDVVIRILPLGFREVVGERGASSPEGSTAVSLNGEPGVPTVGPRKLLLTYCSWICRFTRFREPPKGAFAKDRRHSGRIRYLAILIAFQRGL
jgi:hypothetical protein